MIANLFDDDGGDDDDNDDDDDDVWCMNSETSFENTAQETSTESCHTVGSLEMHNDLTHYYNVPGVSTVSGCQLVDSCPVVYSQTRNKLRPELAGRLGC